MMFANLTFNVVLVPTSRDSDEVKSLERLGYIVDYEWYFKTVEYTLTITVLVRSNLKNLEKK